MYSKFLKSAFPHLLLAMLFFFAAMLIYQWQVEQNQPDVVCAELQEAVLEKENQMRLQLEELKQQNSAEINVKRTGYPRHNPIVLAYKNGQLSKWSNNTIPVPLTYDSIFKQPFFLFESTYFLCTTDSFAGYQWVSLQVVKREYERQNEWVSNRFFIADDIQPSIKIDLQKRENIIYSKDGQALFGLGFSNVYELNLPKESLLFSLFLLSFLFILSFCYKIYQHFFLSKSPWFLLALIGDIVLLRFLIGLIPWPKALHHLQIMRSVVYDFLPKMVSQGDFLMHLMAISVILWAVFETQSRIKSKKIGSVFIRMFLTVLLSAVAVAACVGFVWMLKEIIQNSSISLTFGNFFALDLNTLFILLAFPLLCFILLLILVVLFRVFLHINGKQPDMDFRYKIFPLMLFVSLLSLFTAVVCNYYGKQKERKSRIELAERLAEDRDPYSELLFGQIQKKIETDSVIIAELKKRKPNDRFLEEYLKSTYFKDYWTQYEFQMTRCNKQQTLLIGEVPKEINCHDFFKQQIYSIGRPTDYADFYALDFGIEYSAYLACFNYLRGSDNEVTLYVELFSRIVASDVSYLDLLIDEYFSRTVLNSDYSYAIYYCGELVKQNGVYSYPLEVDWLSDVNDTSYFFRNYPDHSHLIYPLKNGRSLVLTYKQNPLDVLSTFSFLFLFNSVFAVLFYLFVVLSGRHLHWNFRTRLQGVMIQVLFITFILTGVSSLLYINGMNNRKNTDFQKEKAHSVLLEMESRYANFKTLPTNSILNNDLLRLARIFFTDLHLYDQNGRLISTSRPEIFENSMVAPLIHPEALRVLRDEHSHFYTQMEYIGALRYQSVYLPLRNNKNELLAYLDLSYFTREAEQRKEISNFLTAYINIYVILILLALITTFFISRRITNPLVLISRSLSNTKIGKRNQKIEFKHQDEIGELVKEYNRMVDELEHSANKLAESERQAAWSEMAKQVAHEIKNPLTPMKLNVQHVLRAWNDKAPDFDERLERFSKSMIEQIETLSDIATEFSNFAQMPQPQDKAVDLKNVLQNTVELFTYGSQFEIRFHSQLQKAIVHGDEKQLQRLFVNLIKNAIQAVDGKEGTIEISLTEEAQHYQVEIRDNGYGISDEMKERIFEPRFTTKTGGMGLGLSICKSIVESMHGDIFFETSHNEGTRFFVRFPKEN